MQYCNCSHVLLCLDMPVTLITYMCLYTILIHVLKLDSLAGGPDKWSNWISQISLFIRIRRSLFNCWGCLRLLICQDYGLSFISKICFLKFQVLDTLKFETCWSFYMFQISNPIVLMVQLQWKWSVDTLHVKQ